MIAKNTATQLADAAQRIVRANHYFVGLDPATTDGISLDDYLDAYRILVDREYQALVNVGRRPAASRQRTKARREVARRFERVFGVLGAACHRAHNTHLY